MQVAVCPATLTLTTQLGGVSVEDVSRGAGNYPSVLEILDQQPGERFVDVRVVLFMDSRFPDYPGTFLDLRGVVKAPSVTLRMRIVEELKHYLLAGPLAEGLKLFEAENTAAGSLRSVDSLHTPLETIAEEEEEEEEESLFASIVSSLKESALAVGKGLLPGCELRMPHVDFVLHSIRVSVPTASQSTEVASFEMGRLTLQNTLSADPASLNTLSVAVSNMKATTHFVTAAGTNDLALLGGIDLAITAVVSSPLDVKVRITKMAVAMNEEQIAFFVKILKGNLQEKAVVVLDALPTPPSSASSVASDSSISNSLDSIASIDNITSVASTASTAATPMDPALSTGVENTPVEEESLLSLLFPDSYRFFQTLRGEFCFDGICVELLNGAEGYSSADAGEVIYENMGTLKVPPPYSPHQ